MPKVKDKERILKAPREKKLVTYRGEKDSHLISQKNLCRLEGIGNIQSHEKQGPTAKIALPSRAVI